MMPFVFFCLTFSDTTMLFRSIFLLLVFLTTISSNRFYDKFKKLKTITKDKITEKIQEKCKCQLNISFKSIINSKDVLYCVCIHFSLILIVNLKMYSLNLYIYICSTKDKDSRSWVMHATNTVCPPSHDNAFSKSIIVRDDGQNILCLVYIYTLRWPM